MLSGGSRRSRIKVVGLAGGVGGSSSCSRSVTGVRCDTRRRACAESPDRRAKEGGDGACGRSSGRHRFPRLVLVRLLCRGMWAALESAQPLVCLHRPHTDGWLWVGRDGRGVGGRYGGGEGRGNAERVEMVKMIPRSVPRSKE